MDLQRLCQYLLESGEAAYTVSRSKPKGLSVKTVCSIGQIISSAFIGWREPEWFLKKIDDSAEKPRIIGMNCPPELS